MNTAAVLYVGDLLRMQAFYTQCFGLTPLDTDDSYVGLRSGTWLLTLVKSSDAAPTTNPPQRRAGTAVKLAFEVLSINDLRPMVSDLGGQVSAPDAEWDFRNAIHCDCLDPEGNVVQLIQPSGS
jgi:predicted enzyme related to lactoylglutathione lyase